MKNVTLP